MASACRAACLALVATDSSGAGAGARSLRPWQALVGALFRQNQFAIKYDLDAMRAAVEREGLERVAPRVALIAGTNGKGTTAATLNALAMQAGLSVGLYTSPHLISVRERARIDGAPIPEADAQRHLAHVMREYSGQERPAWGERPLSYFELTTLWAMRWFRERRVDLAILEVGLGGRLDATNVFARDIGAITSIGLDHQRWLGDDPESVAREKAGIARAGQALVLHRRSGGFADAQRAASAAGAEVWVVDAGDEPGAWAAAIARTLYSGLPDVPALSPIDVAEALSRVRWPGRRHVWPSGEGLVFLDGAHNAPAIAASVRWLHRELGGTRVPLIVGLSPERSPELLSAYAPFAASWHLTAASSGRSQAPETLRAPWNEGAQAHVSVGDALDATQRAPLRAVLGSLYLVGDALSALGATPASLRVWDESTERRNRNESPA